MICRFGGKSLRNPGVGGFSKQVMQLLKFAVNLNDTGVLDSL